LVKGRDSSRLSIEACSIGGSPGAARVFEVVL